MDDDLLYKHPQHSFRLCRRAYVPLHLVELHSAALDRRVGKAQLLPADDELLCAPVAALALAEERRSGRALLSAAHSLYLADREPNDLERTDRVLHIYAAIEALAIPVTRRGPVRTDSSGFGAFTAARPR